uniref:Uncharacterized protein n=1 Tax=Gorilla gorilla gorilla TaxID=9595 RepID=A0A2I2ZBI0_GORGO
MALLCSSIRRNKPTAPEKVTILRTPKDLKSPLFGRQVRSPQPALPGRVLALLSTEMVLVFHLTNFLMESLFLFSILFVRVSRPLFTNSLQLEHSFPKIW